MRKPYFVGIGAQKAGTSWLGQYFARHPQVGFSPLKELHYFDAVYRADLCSHFDAQFTALLKGRVSALGDRPSPDELLTIRCLTLRLEMPSNRQRYRDYFDLIAQDEHRVVGEITPSYSMLQEDGFAAIREMVPDARFVFILRDPVDRYWSHLRFAEMSQGPERFSAVEEIVARLSDPDMTLRTDYKRTLTALHAVARPNDVCVLFYETLTAPDSHAMELARLTDFLGIEHVPGDLSNHVHPSKAIALGDQYVPVIARRFAEVYEYVAQHYGERMPARWRARLSCLGRRSGRRT